MAISKTKDAIVLSVNLASGDFESSLRVPADLPPDEIKEKMDQWFSMIRFALENNVERVSATLGQQQEGK